MRKAARRTARNEFVIMAMGATLLVALAAGLGESAGSAIVPLVAAVGFILSRRTSGISI